MFNFLIKKTTNRKEIITPAIIYFLFAFMYFYLVIKTYRNELHMDVIYLVATKIKHLFENNLTISDFFYQPLYLGLSATCYAFISAKIFHLNTVIEICLGSIFLILLGYKYLRELNRFLSGYPRLFFFPCMIAFLTFGLQKWEAIFTPAFSLGVFFNLSICVYNFFILSKFVNGEERVKPSQAIIFFFLNLILIFDSAAYFFSYILSLILLLILISRGVKSTINKYNWKIFFYLTASLLFVSLAVVFAFSYVPALHRPASDVSISAFLSTFIEKPLWVIKFYLIATSGPFYGEAVNKLDLRVFLGLFILILYVTAIAYVIKKRKKFLYVPAGMILHNIISYGFITSSRYIFNALEYGASSRYTAFNLLGVLGLCTILFFYIIDEREKLKRVIASASLGIILIFYALVYRTQFRILPYRTSAFLGFQTALLTGDNLAILQADSSVSVEAIAVLKKYNLNVYYKNDILTNGRDTVSLQKSGKVEITAGTEEFDRLIKNGVYEYEKENQFAWTNGNTTIFLEHIIVAKDTLIARLYVSMPEICKKIVPKLSLVDQNEIDHPLNLKLKNENEFTYSLILDKSIKVVKIRILSDTITSQNNDSRVLSFPFKKFELFQAQKGLLTDKDLSVFQPEDTLLTYEDVFKKTGRIDFVAGADFFEKCKKQGFHEYEPINQFSWTNGNAMIMFDNILNAKDSLVVRLHTYMPEICRGITPRIILANQNSSYQLRLKRKEGDLFIYGMTIKKAVKIDRIRILADTITTSDPRTLSFPFKSIELVK